jgi:hypothetical protein
MPEIVRASRVEAILTCIAALSIVVSFWSAVALAIEYGWGPAWNF